jgi:hypothetical protein
LEPLLEHAPPDRATAQGEAVAAAGCESYGAKVAVNTFTLLALIGRVEQLERQVEFLTTLTRDLSDAITAIERELGTTEERSQ